MKPWVWIVLVLAAIVVFVVASRTRKVNISQAGSHPITVAVPVAP